MFIREPESATYEHEYIMDVDEHAMKFLPIMHRYRETRVQKSRVMNSSSGPGEGKECTKNCGYCIYNILIKSAHDESTREFVGIFVYPTQLLYFL